MPNLNTTNYTMERPIEKPVLLLLFWLLCAPLLPFSLYSQVSIIPTIGYDLQKTNSVKNYLNSHFRSDFKTSKNQPKFPIRSLRFGLIASKQMSESIIIKGGIIYSQQSLLFTSCYNSRCNEVLMDFDRLRYFFGLQHLLNSNFHLGSNLLFNNIFKVSLQSPENPQYKSSFTRRKHLAIDLHAGWTFKNFIVGLGYEFGFFNFYDTSQFSATKPISGFGLSLGYQIQLGQ